MAQQIAHKKAEQALEQMKTPKPSIKFQEVVISPMPKPDKSQR